MTFFVLLLPRILLPSPHLIFEHRVYPAFVGLAIAAGALFSLRIQRLTVVLAAVLALVLCLRTFERSAEWNDDIAFYEAHRERFPQDPNALAKLAIRYATTGQINRALEALEEARRNEDRFNTYYSTLGRINIALNLVTLSLSKRDYDRARAELDRALALGPNETQVRLTEGAFYMTVGEPERAVEAYQRITELEPSAVVGWVGLRRAYAQLGREEEAREAEERLQEFQEVEAARNDATWSIPVRFRTHVIFGMLLMFFAITFVCVKFVWSTARQRWSHG